MGRSIRDEFRHLRKRQSQPHGIVCVLLEGALASRWTSGLNPEQIEAVNHSEGPLLILAGAGSGKTTVLVARAGRLIDEGVVEAHRLCVLTFTNKAARELKHRVELKLGASARQMWAGTFHSFGLYLLKKYHKQAGLPRDFGILDSTDGGSIVKELLRGLNQDKTAYDADRILSLLGSFRETGRTEAVKKDDPYEIAVEWLLPRYLKRLEHLGMVDFDGLILKPIELMKDPQVNREIHEEVGYLMVDEFQDTNQTQMRLIRRLAEPNHNLAVVGDDDQSIYGWRGACVSNILGFPAQYKGCKVVRLERNYRSTSSILTLANAVISKNAKRHEKVLRPAATAEKGDLPESLIFETETEESQAVSDDVAELLKNGVLPQDVAVLYRSNGQGAMLEAELRHRNIPYRISGGTAFFDRKEIRDILAYLRCAFLPNEVAFRRIINTPNRGVGEKTIEELTRFCEQKRLTFPQAAKRWQEAGVDAHAGKSIDELFLFLGRWVPHLVSGSGTTPGERLLQLLTELGYRAFIEKHSPDSVTATRKWQLVEMFSRILDRFMEVGGANDRALKDFLDAMELRDTGEDTEKNRKSVQLLTLHACKGLEFDHIYLMGVEEDILPHKRLGSDVAEERRLFYVGITRARKKLTLTRASKRKRHGRVVDVVPSRFILEIPRELFIEHVGGRPLREDRRKSMVAELFKKLDKLETPRRTLGTTLKP